MEFKKIRITDQKNECEYWKDKSAVERLNMVETLRKQLIVTNDNSRKHEIRKIRIQQRI
jgi:hypothetical protein